MVTVTAHTTAPIGIEVVGEGTTTFEVVIPQDSAVPVRKTKVLQPGSQGELVLRVCEGERQIKVSKPEAKTNGVEKSGSDDDSEDEDEEEETREKIWLPTKALGEVTATTKKGAKLEVTINVAADMSVSLTTREVGSSTGVRGHLAKPETMANGQA